MALRWWISILVLVIVMDSYLAKPKGTRKTMKTENGEVVHCVDIYQQPAFSNPLLKNHTLQMKPTTLPQGIKLNDESSTRVQLQTLSCPQGTVPISSSFGPVNDGHGKRKYAVYEQRHPQADMYGVSAFLNVWRPSVEDDDLTIAQLWIMNDIGAAEGELTETMEAGWMVNPRNKQNPTEPVVFVYFTNDGYTDKKCYNLDCGNFVLVSRDFRLGFQVVAASERDRRPQQEVLMAIYKDLNTGNWWFAFEGVPIGYWPREFFKKMGPCDSKKREDIRNARANVAQWGGEIVEGRGSNHPTWTYMGSGSFAQEEEGRAAYMSRVAYNDANIGWRPPESPTSIQDHVKCYNLTDMKHSDKEGAKFYYGGPGGESPECRDAERGD